MYKYCFFLLTVVIPFISCKKNATIEFSINGIITDATFGGGLVDARVTLTEIPISSSNTPKIVGSTILSNDGKYEFTFERTKSEKYILFIEKEKYFEKSIDIMFSEFSSEAPITRNSSTTAKAWFRLRFLNEFPNSSSDLIKWTKQSGKEDCVSCCPKNQEILTGLVNKTYFCVNDGNTNYSFLYDYEVHEFGAITQQLGIESFYTPAFDTVDFVFKF
jgi:hypothetical protein